MQQAKEDDFEDYVKELAKNLKHETNESVINGYKPEMFFVAEDPTTTAEETESEATADSAEEE